MALVPNPSLKLDITGSGVTNSSQTLTWVSGERKEVTLSIKDTDSWVEIDMSDLDKIKIIYADGDDFKLRFHTLTSEFSFDVKGLFVFSTTPEFMATITKIDISTSNTASIKVNVRVFGEA